MGKKWMIAGLRMMPKKELSRLVGHWTRSRTSRFLIPIFTKKYKINLEEAKYPVQHYKSLSEFFIRTLKPEVRPIDQDKRKFVSPVDGRVSQYGRIQKGELIQAKGVTYTVTQLLGDPKEAQQFEGGSYITIYLSPRDYHRVHYPTDGEVIKAVYIPGKLFPVNQMGVEGYPGLFAKNERLITYMNIEDLTTGDARLAVIKVGATIVGSVRVHYDANLSTNKRGGKVEEKIFSPPIPCTRGEEIGYFEFGSTVILLYSKPLEFLPHIQLGAFIKMGEAIGKR
ncbi:archaetidylserine decarboxylase [Microaerobacter geothermalis]|uniref:archaetidylserine decarboxylase n=1 Tax=Microaerobacter geothermalis TaxID=674972 RepID=UPI001EEB8EF9|nr:archaetidylserine decarboxylase [Microaerobacter geothermalis]MCF6092781.1 archaetidylserine decarboxylase [Microaerobacter geothermalis]